MSNIHRCTTSAGMEKGMSENFQTILFCFKGYVVTVTMLKILYKFEYQLCFYDTVVSRKQHTNLKSVPNVLS